MRRRLRKFIGVLVTLAFVVVYALVAMALAQARFVQGRPTCCNGCSTPRSAWAGSCL